MNDRNQPCACGSGIKTKKCCNSPAAHARRREEARLAQQRAFDDAREARRLRAEADEAHFQKTGQRIKRVSSGLLVAAMLGSLMAPPAKTACADETKP